jgi:hypothetical protein
MKVRYLAAALIGAWLVRRRQRQERAGGTASRRAGRNEGAEPHAAPGSPFRPAKGGAMKPEATD